MESVRVAPSASMSVSRALPVGKLVNYSHHLHLHNSAGPLGGSSLVFTLPDSFFRPKLPSKRTAFFRCFSVRLYGCVLCKFSTISRAKTTLDKVVTSHKVVLFMKRTKDFPQCGFSHTVVQILKSLNVPFETINILENDLLRQGLKEYSSWPTFPQLYIDGEFFGGCDITVDAYKSGELREQIEKAMCS